MVKGETEQESDSAGDLEVGSGRAGTQASGASMSLTLVQGYDSDNDERMLRERTKGDVFSDDEEEREGDGEGEGGEEAGASGRGMGNQEPTNGGTHNGSAGRGKKSALPPVHHPSVPAPKVGKTGLPSASSAFDEVHFICLCMCKIPPCHLHQAFPVSHLGRVHSAPLEM